MSAVAVRDYRPIVAGPQVEASDYDPLPDAGRLVELARRSLADAELLDALLCVASLCQAVSDHVHRDIGDMRRIARYASRLPHPVGGAAARALLEAADAKRRLAGARDARLAQWLVELEDFAADVAGAVCTHSAGGESGRLSHRWSELVAACPGIPRQAMAIPPRCFFSFDQRPEDCFELARRYAREWPVRDIPVLVVGVRTSGCFLAPIVAAALRGLGFSVVGWTSWRPGQPVLTADREALRRGLARGARALIVDDPPTSGGSLARVASELVREGFQDGEVILLVAALAGNGAWAARLRRWERVQLEWADWHVHQQLRASAVAEVVASLIPDEEVESAVRIPMDDAPSARKHVRARYRIGLTRPNGSLENREVFVHGVGLGMFGRYASSVAARLEGAVPAVYGVADGLMYREWLAEQHRIDERDAGQREKLAAGIARYAARRAVVLPVPADRATTVSGHNGLWEQASRWLGAGFGRLALPLRPVLHSVGRRLLGPVRPSLIDGAMEEGRWYEKDGALLKTGWDEGAFVYQVPFTYDPAFDVAAAAAERLPDIRFGAVARAEFARATGTNVDELRWFLHRILSQMDARDQVLRQASNPAARARIVETVTERERRIASLHRGFLCDVLLAGVEPSATGDVCAVDVDGVLESARAGYSAPSEAGVLALRRLAMHGFRSVIATGRSLAEAVERCRDYRLAGAVAEYGSAIYVAGQGRIEILLDSEDIVALDALRDALRRTDGVELDPAFGHSVRAFTLEGGRRRAMPVETAGSAIAAAGLEGQVYFVEGWAQTDFVAQGVDKGAGLRRLLDRLGLAPSNLALAVGDAAPDLPMLEMARLGVVVANSNLGPSPNGRIRTARRAYGPGLAQAVDMLLSERGRAGSVSYAPRRASDPDTELLLAALRVGDQPGLAKLPAIVEAMRRLQVGRGPVGQRRDQSGQPLLK